MTILTVTVDHSIEYAQFLPRRDAMHKRGLPPPMAAMPSCGICPSVCPFYCLSRSCSVSKRVIISSFFSPQTVLLFIHTKPWQYSDGDPNGCIECRRDMKKMRNRYFGPVSVWLHRVLSTVRRPVLYIWVLGTM